MYSVFVKWPVSARVKKSPTTEDVGELSCSLWQSIAAFVTAIRLKRENMIRNSIITQDGLFKLIRNIRQIKCLPCVDKSICFFCRVRFRLNDISEELCGSSPVPEIAIFFILLCFFNGRLWLAVFVGAYRRKFMPDLRR